jgi:predicted DNA-binding transcriptional regulator AlpA
VLARKHETPPGSRRLIRIAEVLHMSGLSRTSLYRSIRTEHFPAPVRLTARSVAWPHDEVVAWVEERVRIRNNQR